MNNIERFYRTFKEIFSPSTSFVDQIFSSNPPSEESPMSATRKLLEPGAVEQLVSEGRTPLFQGTCNSCYLVYVIPPKDFGSESKVKIYTDTDFFVFVEENGEEHYADKHFLTPKQTDMVKARISAAEQLKRSNQE